MREIIMRKSPRVAAGIAIVLALFAAPSAKAADPLLRTIIYRGHLDQAGAPYHGQASFRFEFFSDEAGTQPIKTPVCLPTCIDVKVIITKSDVTVDNGSFSVPLALAQNVLEAERVYLSITVTIGGTARQMTTRQQLYPGGLALRGKQDGAFKINGGLAAPKGARFSSAVVDGTVNAWSIRSSAEQVFVRTDTGGEPAGSSATWNCPRSTYGCGIVVTRKLDGNMRNVALRCCAIGKK